MNNKGDLRDIETLLDQMRKQQGVIPLTDDVVEFLLSQSEPIQPSQKLLPELEVIISKAINERETSEQAQRQQASTFGEYIKAFQEKVQNMLGLFSIRDALSISISQESYAKVEKDAISGVPVTEIAQIIVHLAVPYAIAINLLKNSLKVEQFKLKKLMVPSNARVDEKPNTEARHKATTSPMQKLLLSLDAERKLSDIDDQWQIIKGELDQELKALNYI